MRRNTGAAALIRRGSVTLAAFVAVAASAGGCGPADKDGSAAAPSTPSQSPRETLLASVPDDSKGPFRFSGKDATNDISGSVDPTAKGMLLSTSVKDPEHRFTMKMAFLVIDQQTWMKVSFTGAKGVTGLPKLPAKWLKLDRAKIKDAGTAPVYDGVDQGNSGPLLDAATKVEDKGSGQYTGVIDLTQGSAAQVLEPDQMTALGAAAKAIPFRAKIGADKNLASLTLDIPAAGKAKAFQYSVNYRDYGSAPKIAVPAAGQAQDAPALAYQLLNG
jgi:hypothetical protein